MLTEFFATHGTSPTYWIAYSGGLDSHVLLHMAAEYRKKFPIKLRAIHVHHQLNTKANAWVAHAEKICRALQIELVVRQVDANLPEDVTESPEEYARQKRYQVFQELLSAQDFLLTAHHADDQAETVLLQLLRGAGPKGLAAMPIVKSLLPGYHARPLLLQTRASLLQYATLNQLQWIQDDSNDNVNFARNFIRHQVLPQLQTRWPALSATLTRSAQLCAEHEQLLQNFIAEDFLAVQGAKPNTLSVSQLRQLEPRRQRQVLRYWLQQLHFPLPSVSKMQHIQNDMLYAHEDKRPQVTWKNTELRRYRDDLYVMRPLMAHDAGKVYHWDLAISKLLIPGIGCLHVHAGRGGLCRDITSIEIRFRQMGEKFQLNNRSYRRTLKNFFQEQRVPSWLRDRIPLIFVQGELVGAVGYFIVEKFKDPEVGACVSLKESL